MDQKRFKQLLRQEIQQMSQIAIIEDLAGSENSDITAELVPASHFAKATLMTRESGILCGTEWAEKIFETLGSQVTLTWNFQDGDAINSGDILCNLQGNARALLTGERSAMNFLQSLSATSTLTSQYVEKLRNTQCKLLDTRKTIPGMRFGQKYAVICGGGTNHRIGLSDAYLIKENHIMVCGSIDKALKTAKQNNPDKLLEIEVESLYELEQALDGGAQIVMLDNFNLDTMAEAIEVRDKHDNPAKLEASGNISLFTITDIAQTGVDYVSIGAITKNVKALDLSMRIDMGH